MPVSGVLSRTSAHTGPVPPILLLALTYKLCARCWMARWGLDRMVLGIQSAHGGGANKAGVKEGSLREACSG